MKDRNRVRLHKGDRVRIQTSPDGPVHFGVVTERDTVHAKELQAVLVAFEGGGQPQFMKGDALEVANF